MKKTDRLYGYIKGILPVVICGMLCICVFGITFYIANLEMEYFKMAAEFILFILAIYMIVYFIMYRKRMTLKEELFKIKAENNTLRSENLSERKDLQEYFLTWVHQIKTPITVSRLLLDEMEDTDNVEHLKTEMIYIEGYVNMALSYLKLFNHERDMDITSVELDKVINPILKRYSRIFIRNHIGIIYENRGDRVITDAKWLSALLEQIISNAVKYTKNGNVEISFDRAKNRLVISDSGIGIRSEDIPKIFDKGYSGFNGRLNQKSSGIGLYMAKKIAHKLSMTIDVESKVGKGSSFFIYFNELHRKNGV